MKQKAGLLTMLGLFICSGMITRAGTALAAHTGEKEFAKWVACLRNSVIWMRSDAWRPA